MSWTIQGSNPSKSKRFFSSPHHPDQLWSPPSLLFSRLGAFPLAKQLDMKFSTHLCLVLRLRMSGTVHLFHLYAFVACTGATLFFLPLSYFLLAPSAQILIHFFFSGGSEVFSVGLYHVVNFIFFLTAYLVIMCLIRYVCCVFCCLLLCNVYAGSLTRSEIKL
jgi:hypothetical protein